jgi:hypothetical protein
MNFGLIILELLYYIAIIGAFLLILKCFFDEK